MRRPRTGPAVVVLVLATLGVAVALGRPGPGRPPTAADLIAVGVPRADGGTGAVDVFRPDGTAFRLTPAGLGIEVTPGMAFGSSIAVDDLNGDGRTDLLVGADGGWPAPAVAGGAWILLRDGRDGGSFLASGIRELPSAGGPDGGFGHAVAISTRADGSTPDVWVGAPGTRVGADAGAGAVHRFQLGRDAEVGADEVVTQESPVVSSSAEPGDGFGEVLAPAQNGVFVGIPHEDVGSRVDVGSVQRLRTDPVTNDQVPGRSLAEGGDDLPGGSDAGDMFGAAISRDGWVIGSPGEDVEDVKDAGAVVVFGSDDHAIGGGVVEVTQDSPGMPGAAEPGDRFGSAVAVGRFGCAGELAAAIGAPGESVGSTGGAGAVTMIRLQGTAREGCLPVQLIPGSSLPGAAEQGGATGSSLGLVPGGATTGPAGGDTLLIGSPAHSTGGETRTGRVILRRSRNDVEGMFGAIGGDVAGLGFGTSLPS